LDEGQREDLRQDHASFGAAFGLKMPYRPTLWVIHLSLLRRNVPKRLRRIALFSNLRHSLSSSS